MGKERVRCMRLSSVLASLKMATTAFPCNIALLKCDVEGAEVSVLQGLAEADWSCVQRVAIEIHSSDALLVLRKLLAANFKGDVWSHSQPDLPDHFMLYGDCGDEGAEENLQRVLKRHRVDILQNLEGCPKK